MMEVNVFCQGLSGWGDGVTNRRPRFHIILNYHVNLTLHSYHHSILYYKSIPNWKRLSLATGGSYVGGAMWEELYGRRYVGDILGDISRKLSEGSSKWNAMRSNFRWKFTTWQWEEFFRVTYKDCFIYLARTIFALVSRSTVIYFFQ